MPTEPLEDWNSDVADCFEDASSCCYGFWCCPCLASTVTVRLGENRCLLICDVCSAITSVFAKVPILVPPALLALRVAMRHRYNIKGSICNDLAISCFCGGCSWCQMHRELRHRNKAPVVVTVQQPLLQLAPVMMALPPTKLPL